MRLLAGAGVISLQCVPDALPAWPCPSPRLRDNRSVVRVIVDGVKVLFDLDDSFVMTPSGLTWADYCFKRMLRMQDESDKVLPYGLNYPVALDGEPTLTSWRAAPPLRMFQRSNDPGRGVVFMTRLWDPVDARTEREADERAVMNRGRIALARALRDCLGGDLVGGVEADGFSLRECDGDLLIDAATTVKSSYLRAVRSAAVVVTSRGLHGSIGWRTGEALALGRPLMTEPMGERLPHPLTPGRHYRPFAAPTDCGEIARELLSSPDTCERMRTEVSDYYDAWLAPDALMVRHLAKVVLG